MHARSRCTAPSISTDDPIASATLHCASRTGSTSSRTSRWSSAGPIDQIRRADGPPQTLRLSCEAALPLARLEVSDAATQEAIAAHCKSLYAGHAAATQTWRIVFWSLAAVGSIIGLAWFGIPYAADRLAPMVPMAVEQRIGEAVDKQARAIFGGKVCDSAEGQAAFTSLVDKLKRAGGDRPAARGARAVLQRPERLRAAGRKDLSARRAAAEGARSRRDRRRARPRARACACTATACARSSRPAEPRS